MNLKRLRADNADDNIGLSREEIDRLINYCERLENYYDKPHKFKAGRRPNVCQLCGLRRELHDNSTSKSLNKTFRKEENIVNHALVKRLKKLREGINGTFLLIEAVERKK